MNEKTVWETYDETQKQEMEATCRWYMDCLDQAKTEREAARLSVKLARQAGYTDLMDAVKEGRKLQAGDKVYAVYNEKTVILYHIGTENPENGMNILCAHIDSPRLDVKQNPLYEAEGFAYLDTHYYGGIKKYQWVTIPLAIHGVVAQKDGRIIEVNIGEADTDPVFTITDVLPHLGGAQMEKKASVVIEGEKLDLLIGSRPAVKADDAVKASDTADANDNGKAEEAADACRAEETADADDAAKQKEGVKAAILQLLKEKYDMEEDDFLSAELEIVPAGRARELGLDRSMILAYGHDDRICAFTSLKAMLEMEDVPARTACCILVDKEEIGSCGASGMQSRYFENMTAEVLTLCGLTSSLSVRRCLQNSKMLSSDVNAAYDPLYADVYEKKNAAFFGKGLVFSKYTGSRGKSGSNDANAEYMAQLRKVFDDNQAAYQTAELGRVDVGGGGTIAWIAAVYGMEVIDSGVALLCMHAPMEVASKADVYEAVKGYKAFLKDMK